MTPEAIQNFNLDSFLDTAVSLTAAFLLGGLIGLERQYRQRMAGLRTNVLVALGAAIFVDMANRLGGHDGALHVTAYVVSGIGFLGAGVIMREDGNVRGLNTAATLWGSAAVGACAGADLLPEAIMATLFVLAANTLLRRLSDRLNRQPLDGAVMELTSTIYVIASRAQRKEAQAQLQALLSLHVLQTRGMLVHAFGDHSVEIEAHLASTAVESEVVQALIQALGAHPAVEQAFWSAGAAE